VPPPGLYLLWPGLNHKVPDFPVPTGFTLRTCRESDEQDLLNLLESDGESMTEKEWHHYRDILLPNGLYLVEEAESSKLVATAGAAHSPNPGRYYFPFGGELGYLAVDRAYRRRGLGRAVCAAVIQRFFSAGYENIRVCVQEHRHAAIHLYLRLGFRPFMHSAEIESRWRRVCETIGWPFTLDLWPKHL
jgi:ribosomal protein S18 acetylase RimI-like enzyme